MDNYKKGIYNNELRKLLLLHKPLLTMINKLKAEVHHYQMSLLKYARGTPHIALLAMAVLGTMEHEITDQRQKTIQKIQELQ